MGPLPAPVIRRARPFRGRALACLAAGAVAAGCLPRGAPPAGRQLVADRTSTLAGIVPSTGDGVVRVLFTRPGPNPQPDNPNARTSDLYVVSLDPNGGAPSERLLAGQIPVFLIGGCSTGQTSCFPSDARGRVFVPTSSDPTTGQSVVERIDPVTGDRLDVHNGSYYLSPSGRRLIVFTSTDARGTHTTATLYEADDRSTVIEGMSTLAFVGADEDLYHLKTDQALERIPPGGPPEVVATGVDYFGLLGPTNALLLLGRPTADPTVSTFSIFDPATAQETPYPFAARSLVDTARVTASPDGRWLLEVDGGPDNMVARYTFADRLTGASDVFQLPASFGSNYQWRPLHAELWIGNGFVDDPTIWIKAPGAPAVSTTGLPFGLTEASDPSRPSASFTPDGSHWFSAEYGPDPEHPEVRLQLASADDPAGPRFDLGPADENQGMYWQLADGRILLPTFKKAPARSDIYAFDPATGDARLLGEAGRVTAVGRTRLLAILHVLDNPGDLTAVELASGRPTILAAEFTLSAFVEPQVADPVAPGTHVAYQFLARFPSAYDGIWVATVP